MYLRRVEIYGFKSFGRRASLDLDATLNAVVGPNGCGKSNLLDAVRWALGEGNLRVLRGGRTEDVIFAGTRQLKPLGVAEVSLTFDNSDGSLPWPGAEVCITRRAYRSGASVFALNGTPCRLRDIHALLGRAGLTPRLPCFVGQGEAEALLMGSPEQRRAVLEEAAGLSRTRQLAGQSEADLEQAHRALERAQAALVELERHVTFLQSQAARARSAQRLSAQLAAVEQELARRQLELARAQAQRAQADRDQAAQALQRLRERLAQLRGQLQEQLQRYQSLAA
ncbi:MAG TPA: AAA family ATPase, partial [Limnochordales bacterium]